MRALRGGLEPTLDKLVEVTFTVNPRVRRIAAHDPDSLPLSEYMRQIFWGSGANLPDDIGGVVQTHVTLDAMELPSGEKAAMSLTLPEGFVIAFDPVTHATMFLDVKGEPTRERRNLVAGVRRRARPQRHDDLQPGPARIAFENKSARRTLPGVWLQPTSSRRCPAGGGHFFTATRLLSNQEFRDLYRSGTFDPDQRFKITSLTILFTDLRGSTALYDRVGDLAAFDLVRSHFGELIAAVSAEGGAVVKTIGDAVMATFPTPDRALRSAMRMREAMRKINVERGSEDLALNIGLHVGPVPGGDARRPAGLFRADRQYCGPRPGPRRTGGDAGDEADHGKPGGRPPARRIELSNEAAAVIAAVARGQRSVRNLRGPGTRNRRGRRNSPYSPDRPQKRPIGICVSSTGAGRPASGLLPPENHLAPAVENPQRDRLWRPGRGCSGDDRGGNIRSADLDFPQ